MIQGREDFRFALKPREPIRVCGERRREDLERDLALQLRIGSTVHLAHTTHADLGEDFVGAETGADGKGQCFA